MEENTKAEHKKKRIVVPGDLLTDERKKIGQHVFVENGKVYSDVLGINYPDSSVAYVVPLHGNYIPQRDDLVVGIVSKETVKGYMVDINSIYESYIPEDAARDRLKRGSIVSAKIGDVDELNEADLFDVRVFYGGEIVSVSPTKIPRVIGKNGSMLNVLKSGTGCSLLAGRNGWVWVKDGDAALLKEALSLIEREAHLDNLTIKVEEFLKSKKVK
jgi:exosome complex component RRP4